MTSIACIPWQPKKGPRFYGDTTKRNAECVVGGKKTVFIFRIKGLKKQKYNSVEYTFEKNRGKNRCGEKRR